VLFEAPQVISASGTQTLVQSGENYHYRHSAKLGKGTHVLLGTYKPTYWTKKADGKWAMAKTRADFPDAQSCGLYSMSGKSFVIIDDDGAFASAQGLGCEVVQVGAPASDSTGEAACAPSDALVVGRLAELALDLCEGAPVPGNRGHLGLSAHDGRAAVLELVDGLLVLLPVDRPARGPVAEELEHGCYHERPDDDGQRAGDDSDRDGPDNTES